MQKFILLMLLFSFQVSSQEKIKTIKVKKQEDSINYTYLNSQSYALKKILENGLQVPFNCAGALFFKPRILADEWLMNYATRNGVALKLTIHS